MSRKPSKKARASKDVSKKLNPKQELFVLEYMKDRNATRAYIAAGYSGKGARVSASQLLANPIVQEKVKEKGAEITNKLEIDASKILQRLLSIANFDPGFLHNSDGSPRQMNEIDPEHRMMLTSYEVNELFDGSGDQKHAYGLTKKIKWSDSLKALEILCKYCPEFRERLELSGPGGGPIQNDVMLQVVFVDAKDSRDDDDE